MPMTPTLGRRAILASTSEAESCGKGASGVWLHERISAMGLEHPERVAVVGEDFRMSYGELGWRTGEIAGVLKWMGVGPGMLVGICVRRAAEMIIGLLGVLQAGGAYLPINARDPEVRIRTIVEGAGPSVMLADNASADLLIRLGFEPVRTGVELGLRIFRLKARQDDKAPEPRGLCGDDPAYVIFTSGSTGRPKGVVISHANLEYSTDARVAYYGRRVERFFLLASAAFDSSVAGIFWTLSQGGMLCLPADEMMEPRRLAGFVQSWGITHLLALPSVYSLLLGGARMEFGTLHTVIVAGEVCWPGLVQEHFRRVPHADLYNEYGPTEATVWSTVFNCKEFDRGSSVPIGRPIVGTRIHVLDENLAPVQTGQVGELHISGPGVGLGYWKRSDLTAERFLVDRWSGSGGRMYRTGDLGRYRWDGNLEYVGRKDYQVKVGGYRVELEEIETHLMDHPLIEECAVKARHMGEGDTRLTCCFVGREAVDSSVLSAFLGERLPGYMIPSVWVSMERLPRLGNGKIDRAALPDSSGSGIQEAKKGEPGTELERALVEIWREVLKVNEVGIRDDFLELGGHSLLAAKVISRAAAQFGVEVTARDFFENPTVEGMAKAIERARLFGQPVRGQIRKLRRNSS